MVAHSATLAINEQMEERRATGRPGLHMGFGEAGLPVLPSAARALAGAVQQSSYAPVAGSPEARRAAAGWFTRRNLPTEPEQIVFGPGSKPLLYALLAALPGDVVLPQPSWVSYAPQAHLAGKEVVGVPVPASAGGVPDPERLGEAVAQARAAGRRPGILVLTLPDNPTGTVAGPSLLAQVCRAAEEHDLAVVADEIYRDLCYEPAAFRSPTALLPDRCFVTSGLSKSMALGGWRVGFARFPAGDLGERVRDEVIGVASEVWSSMAGPVQPVATHVLDEPPDVEAHVSAGRHLHRRVATAVHAQLVEAGALCRAPQGGFYLYPDLEPRRDRLERHGVTTGAELAEHLMERHGIGVLPGEAFGDDPGALRFRAATSLLYGTTPEQRWEALESADPVALPWVAAALNHLRGALATL